MIHTTECDQKDQICRTSYNLAPWFHWPASHLSLRHAPQQFWMPEYNLHPRLAANRSRIRIMYLKVITLPALNQPCSESWHRHHPSNIQLRPSQTKADQRSKNISKSIHILLESAINASSKARMTVSRAVSACIQILHRHPNILCMSYEEDSIKRWKLRAVSHLTKSLFLGSTVNMIRPAFG